MAADSSAPEGRSFFFFLNLHQIDGIRLFQAVPAVVLVPTGNTEGIGHVVGGGAGWGEGTIGRKLFELEPFCQQFRRAGLEGQRDEDGREGHRGDDPGAGHVGRQHHACQRCRDDAGLADPAHVEDFLEGPFGLAVPEDAEENGNRAGHEDQHRHDEEGPAKVREQDGEVNARAEQDENHHAQDQGQDFFEADLGLVLLFWDPEAYDFLVAANHAHYEDSQEAAEIEVGGQDVGGDHCGEANF